MANKQRRTREGNRNGIHLSIWAPTAVIAQIDALAAQHGGNRSKAIKEAVAAAYRER